MDKQCENLETCGFFQKYNGNTEVIKNGWINMYCESEAKSQKCQRKQIKQMTGKPPEDNMTPMGEFL